MASFRFRSNRWQARITRQGILAQKSFTNKRDAQQWARITEAEIERGEYTPTSPTVSENKPDKLDDLFTRYENEVAPQHRSEASIYNIRVLRRMLGEIILVDLNAQVIARWRDARLKMVKSGSVVREMHTLSSILNHARREWCYPIVNPIPDVKHPSLGQPRSRRLLDGEEDRLMAALEPRYAPIVRFALATAMRQGEILSLTWRNTDLVKRVALLPITKNGAARRVPLSTVATQILEERSRQPVQPITGIVFDVVKSSLNHAWCRACKKAEIDDLHFHDLRHEAITRFFERGLNMMEVASISGHKTLQMLKRYTHLRAEELAQKMG